MDNFGQAIITPVSQTGFPDARCAYLEKSACFVTGAWINEAGSAFVPTAVRYRVDDVVSGFNVVPWTAVTPALVNQIIITSPQNAMVSLTLESESRQVLFEVTDGFGNVTYTRAFYDLIRVLGNVTCCEDMWHDAELCDT